MPGKRATQKDFLRKKILTAARDLFLTQSFESTTIGQIAERAGVGMGTAFNYFNSKEELFLLSMAQDIEAKVASAADNPVNGERPVDAVVSLALSNLKRMNMFDKQIWRTVMAAFFASMKSNNPAVMALTAADRNVMEKISALLEEFKHRGELAADFQVSTAVNLIYGSMVLHVAMYIYVDTVTAEETFSKIESDIRFVLGR